MSKLAAETKIKIFFHEETTYNSEENVSAQNTYETEQDNVVQEELENNFDANEQSDKIESMEVDGIGRSQVELIQSSELSTMISKGSTHYSCKDCGYQSSRKWAVKRHLLLKHALVRESIECKDCQRSFKSKAGHDWHTCKSNSNIQPVHKFGEENLAKISQGK